MELGHFDVINIGFLIVGHTHCNLDQFFSVLARKIHSAPFIASPLAMRDLISIAHKDPKERPLHNIHVEMVHDYKTLFEPIVNKNLKFYQVPHRFRIKRVCGRAIFQYLLFTPEGTSAGRKEDYLPHEPEGMLGFEQLEEYAKQKVTRQVNI